MSTFKSLYIGRKMTFFPFTISRREVLLSYLITHLSAHVMFTTYLGSCEGH